MDEEEYDTPWNDYFRRLENLPAPASYGPASTAPISKNCGSVPSVERGDDSLSVMSSFLQFNQQGQHLQVENLLQESHKPSRTSLEDTIENLSNNFAFTRKHINSVPPEKTKQILAECFVKKGELELCDPSLTERDYVVLFDRVWDRLQDFGFVLVDENNIIRGVALSADTTNLEDLPLGGLHPHLIEVFTYLDEITAKVASEFPADPKIPGRVKAHFLMGTPAYNTAVENVYAMYLLIKHSHEVAREHDFQMSIAQNTNQVTQQLAVMYNCKRLLIDQPREWTNAQDRKPFAACRDSFVVTVDVVQYS